MSKNTEKTIENKKNSGRNTKYSPDFCNKLLKLAESQNLDAFSVQSFCHEQKISERSYYTYVREHEEFREAHERALAITKSKWLAEGARSLSKRDYSHWGWDRQLAWRFGDHRIYLEAFISAETWSDKAMVAIEAAVRGEITLEQCDKLLYVCERSVKLLESDELQRRIAALEFALQQQNNNSNGNAD
jgi:hypothetical protein